MRNIPIRERTAQKIDDQVAKVLKGLGNPEPPLRLTDVRALLLLDQQYYSSTDDGMLREVVSRMMVAGKQVVGRPMLLLEAIKALDLKALYLPDQKRILLDKEQPEAKWRWNEAHEITHSLLPWHNSFMQGDNAITLTPTCHDCIEAEANFGAGRLLFMQDKFKQRVLDSAPSIKTVQELKKLFSNSLTSTLWRYVEQNDRIMVGVVSAHPHYRPDDFDPAAPCRYFISSSGFAKKFGNVTETDVFNCIDSYCSWKKKGPLGEEEVVLTDCVGVQHVFHFETFSNQYDALTLGYYKEVKTEIF